MGRVYDIEPDLSKGERPWPNSVRVAALGPGLRRDEEVGDLRYVVRVEFDEDADVGPATVTTCVLLSSGYLAWPVKEGDRAPRVTFRTRVRLVAIPPTPIPVRVVEHRSSIAGTEWSPEESDGGRR